MVRAGHVIRQYLPHNEMQNNFCVKLFAVRVLSCPAAPAGRFLLAHDYSNELWQ